MKKKKRKKSQKTQSTFKRKKKRQIKRKRKVKNKKLLKNSHKKKKRKKAKKKRTKLASKKKKVSRSINLALNLIRAGEKIKSFFIFRVDLDKKLQSFFLKISKKISSIKNAIDREREKQKKQKILLMQKEKIETEKRINIERDELFKAKQQEYRDELKLEKERKKELQRFVREAQAEVRKEQAEKQRKFLEQIKLGKKIEQFRKREVLEIRNLEKYVLGQQRDSYSLVQERIQDIKIRYQKLRDQKIAERVKALGVEIEEGDDRATLLEKEKTYYQERQKIEFALESFYRSAHSLCFQISKRYIPKYLNILRCVDQRLERGEIFIKWDDTPDEDWLILIYLDSNSPDGGIIIEDKTNPEKNASREFKSSEIFQASDMMVDALINLLDRERNKRKAS
tara:strand:+ start:364 stop:1551 length:1188 start_codon:yes stop_codon:yes gene_type:complete